MSTDWEMIEDSIKSSNDHWERFKFTFIQTSHSYINLFVEKFREWNIPYEYELGHIIGYGLLMLISLFSPIIAIVGIANVVYNAIRPEGDT